MSAKREIKVPLSQMWREFRIRFVPAGVFICGLVSAVYLWSITVVGPTMVGEVQAMQALVRTPQAGILTNVLVSPFQIVKAGDPVAEIIVTDVRASSSRVQELRSEVALSQLEINSYLDQERILFDYSSLNMNTLRFRADLAAARAQMPTVEAALQRNQELLEAKVLAFSEYELSLRLRNSLKAWIAELERLVSESEAQLKLVGPLATSFTNAPARGNLADPLARLKSERDRSETLRHATTLLRAPIDGMVGSIVRSAGENIPEGDPVLTIHAMEGQRILAYLRQGQMLTPTKGTPVRVRCRSRAREEALAEVQEIGFRFEVITNLALIRPGMSFESGMPISVSMPAPLRSLLRPGELVDLALEP
jgi:multidrug resistance efflux pump